MKNKFEFENINKNKEEPKLKTKPKDKKEDVKKTKEDLKNEKKKKIKKFMILILLHVIASILLIGLGLIWQNSYDIMAWSNASLLAFIMIFFAGWIMFIHNKNIISAVTHSFKIFGLMIVGKRPAKSYYEVKTDIEENQIPKKYIVTTFLYSIVLLVLTIILTIFAL